MAETETLRILVVDDEPGMRLAVQRTLRSFTVSLPDIHADVGFQVELAESGEEAIQVIQARPPDILLLDHKLPAMSGLEVLDEIGQRQDEMLTIMITAYASLETAVTAIKRGAYDFLAKPFTPEELKNVVRKAAGRILLARQARRLVQEKRQVRFQFISVVAHELKSPLAAIEGYMDILGKGIGRDDPAMLNQMLQRCQVRAAQMRKLVTDLLDLTRIESGQKKRELAELDVHELAQQAIEGMKTEAASREITIQLHGDGPTKLLGDRGEIESVLNNLISNAVKYNRPGGKVDVRLGQDGGKTTIAVADTGIGMTAEETGRLFTEFARIKNDKTRNILGSGLGLSIVKKIALLCGGDVCVASTPDAGSTFTVTLCQ